MSSAEKVTVLFVCLGNICRSPTAEGVFRKLVTEAGLNHLIEIDSAGTGDWHVGRCPDPRAQKEATRRGIDISSLRGRQVCKQDFERFDYICAMDAENMFELQRHCPKHLRHKLHRFADFAPHLGIAEVPDPYGGGEEGFRHVYDICLASSEGLLRDIQQRLLEQKA